MEKPTNRAETAKKQGEIINPTLAKKIEACLLKHDKIELSLRGGQVEVRAIKSTRLI